MHRLWAVLFLAVLLTLAATNIDYLKQLAYTLKISGDKTTSCCKVEDILKASGDFDPMADVAIFNSQVVDYPKDYLAKVDRDQAVLGTTNAAGEEKWIDVSLSEQKLRAYEGDRVVLEFLISSGKWSPTPTGDFNIWYKTKRQRMEGGSKVLGTYYNLPNVPSNMFFYKGYAIHGAYWHNNFGHPMSHGCVNSPLDKVAELFDWAGPVVPEGQNVVRASAENPGTRVLVH